MAKPASPCARCGVSPKIPGPGNRYCAECRIVVNSPAAVRARVNINASSARERRGVAKRKSLLAPPGTKWCSACERYLKLDQFGAYVKSGTRHPYCKSCHSVAIHGRQMNARFGISADEYTSMLESQGGGCAICGSKPKRQRLAVDHDHRTGFIRGLLCKMCNKGVLGGAKDSVEILRSAVAYLDSPPAFDIVGERVAPNPTGRRKK